MKPVKPLSELISLKGKHALVTGAAVGIGRAIAHRLAEAGADLELADIDFKGLQAVKKELKQFKSRVNLYELDLSQKSKIDTLWRGLTGEEPDILVNNAGIYPFKNFLEVDEAFLKKVMDINLTSVLWMCQYMIKQRAKRGGVIVNVASIEALLPFADGLVAYNVSKIGVIGLTRALARDYGKEGFRVNVVLPGGIVTPGTRNVARELAHLRLSLIDTGIKFKGRLPLNRAGQPDEVARMVLVLASDLASYVQGAVVPVDGGFLSA
jgi:NAD(P)-dependent dehydrogenase (short-subunit alcohol dehydrogenase family)